MNGGVFYDMSGLCKRHLGSSLVSLPKVEIEDRELAGEKAIKKEMNEGGVNMELD